MSDPIPSSRRFPWEANVTVGVIGGIPTLSGTSRNVVSLYAADTTGATDASTAIATALAISVPGDIVYCPAGTYRLESALTVPAGVLLVGAGNDATIFDVRFNGLAVILLGIDPSISSPVTFTNYTQGSTTIVVSDATGLSIGDELLLSEGNDATKPVFDVFGNGGIRRHATQITGIAETTLTISTPLVWTFSASLSPTVSKISHYSGGGVESLRLRMDDSTTTFGLYYQGTVGAWVRDVSILNYTSYGIYLNYAYQCEVHGCDVKGSASGGSNGAGILVERSTACLIENNLILDSFPSIEVNFSCTANVFAYNLCENTPIAGSIRYALNSNHGAHNSFNLYEGNFGPNLEADGYFGSTSDDTIHRNCFHGSCLDNTATTATLLLKRGTRYYNVTGNIFGRSGIANGGFVLGQPNIGNGSSIGTAQPSLGDDWADTSITGTLTTRTDDNSGVVTVTGGNLEAEYAANPTAFTIQLFWGGYAFAKKVYVTGVTGSVVTFAIGPTAGTALPIAGTSFDFIGAGPSGFQELDLDVEATLLDKGNFFYTGAGTGTTSSLGGDTLPDSYFRSSTPAYFTAAGKSFPPFTPQPGSESYETLPAGDRLPPNITSAAAATAYLGEVFSFQITTGISATSYAATGLPSGVTINTATGLISGTPLATAVSNVTITATNDAGTSEDFAFTLTVRAARSGRFTCLTLGHVRAAVVIHPITISNEYDGHD